MKLKFFYALAIAGATCAFTSCSDDVKVPGSSLEEKTYSAENLTLSLDGNAVVGKVVSFVPAADGTANITLTGEPLNVMEIMDALGRAEGELVFPTAGVLPGSPSVTIPVTLQGDVDNCTFSGSGETSYCTYAYSGSATADKFELSLTDVELKNKSIAGTWNMLDFLRNPEDEQSGYFFNVARVEWKATKGAEIELFPGVPIEMPVETVVRLALAMPMLEPNEKGEPTTPVLKMLSTVLKSVTFGENGEITAKYLDVETGMEAESNPGLAQYVVEADGSLRLFLNPGAIIANTVANTTTDSRAADIASIVEGLISQLVPMLTNGIPVSYGPAIIAEDGTTSADEAEGSTFEGLTSFYLNTETLLPILKTVAPLLADEAFVNSIMEQVASEPSMAAVAGSIGGILKSFPEIVETTKTVEIGINLKK